MNTYRYKSGGKDIVVRGYAEAKDRLDVIYVRQRLHLPFEGMLLFGY